MDFICKRSDRGYLGFRYFVQRTAWQTLRRLHLGWWWFGFDTKRPTPAAASKKEQRDE